MSEKLFYQFDNFQVDSSKHLLLREGRPIPLAAKPFQLLLTLIESDGKSISKEDLINRVWPRMTVTDTNFHVNLDKVRKALGETGREPRYIIRTSDGYRFNADIYQIPLGGKSITRETGLGWRAAGALTFPWWHFVVSLTLYSALYAESVVLELAYDWSNQAALAINLTLPVFAWIFTTSSGALILSWRYARRGVKLSLVIPIGVFVLAVMLLYSLLIFILPDFVITQATFQTRPAHAAYLKDISYFLPLGVVFIVMPFHFIAAARRDMLEKGCQSLFDFLSRIREAVPPSGSVYLPPWVLGLLLSSAAVFSLAATNHLLDNLKPGLNNNLFTHLVMWRVLLYFALGLECLLWYYRSLSQIKSDCSVNSEN